MWIFRIAKQQLQACPVCFMPGFGDVQKISGMPCEWCGEATDRVKEKIIACKHHQHQVTHKIEKQVFPMYCNQCNP